MYKLLVLDKLYVPMFNIVKDIAPEELEVIQAADKDSDEYDQQLSQADFIMTISECITPELLDKAEKLKLVHLWGVGFDKINVEECHRRGIVVARTTGVNSTSVAEQAVMLMLAVYRKIVKADQILRSGYWPRWELRMTSYELAGKKVGIVGIGQIGQKVARRLKGFDTHTFYYDVFKLDEEKQRELGIEGYMDLEELLTTCDVITLHCPLTEETRHLINKETLRRMKKTSIIINCSRGQVINEQDLYEALKNGEILGAGLDVFEKEPIEKDNPLISLDNVVLTPHLAAATIDTSTAMAVTLLGNIKRYIDGIEIEKKYII